MPISADEAIEIFETAKEENLISPLRRGQVVYLPAGAEVWMTGDLHDHRNNFNKLLRASKLDQNPDRHLILHELIHGDHFDASGAEDSWITLIEAARLKCDHSQQVHFLLANHDLAQIHGEGIMKAGLSVCEAFHRGLKRDFPEKYHRIEAVISDFLLSLPLAVRAPNGLFFCHSIPRGSEIEAFDFGVFDRELTGADYQRKTGPAYQLIWGRGADEAAAGAFADRVGASILVTGHQPQETGFDVNGPRHLILASDHNQGVFLPVSTDQTYDMQTLVRRLKKFVAVPLDD